MRLSYCANVHTRKVEGESARDVVRLMHSRTLFLGWRTPTRLLLSLDPEGSRADAMLKSLHLRGVFNPQRSDLQQLIVLQRGPTRVERLPHGGLFLAHRGGDARSDDKESSKLCSCLYGFNVTVILL